MTNEFLTTIMNEVHEEFGIELWPEELYDFVCKEWEKCDRGCGTHTNTFHHLCVSTRFFFDTETFRFSVWDPDWNGGILVDVYLEQDGEIRVQRTQMKVA